MFPLDAQGSNPGIGCPAEAPVSVPEIDHPGLGCVHEWQVVEWPLGVGLAVSKLACQ